MSLVLPSGQVLPFPADATDPGTGSTPDGGADGAPSPGTAGDNTTVFAPENKATALNQLSAGAIQGSTSVQNAPIKQGG
jgi:hypothetical protein